MRSLLRATAIMSSLVLLFGCVWFTQKKANPTMMPSSKLLILPEQTKNEKLIMPGSKSISHLIEPAQKPQPKMMMPGSKSYTGAPTISAGSLQMQTDKQQAAKP